MRIWPVLLDFVPDYLEPGGSSLLQTPIGSTLLASRLCQRIQQVTANAPVIVPPPQRSGLAYRTALLEACPNASILAEGDQLVDHLPPIETSDVCLFVDARCFPVDDAGLLALVEASASGRQIAHHLVAFEASLSGTREHVTIDGVGRVRSIHRYYQPTTWPFIAGVAASLIPVSSNLLYLESIPSSLDALRRRLACGGAPGRDIAVEGVALDLTKRHGLLAAMERCVVDEVNRARAAGRSATVLVGGGHVIAPTARILGPVVVHARARIGENATIVGPALIGEDAQILPGAVVAHALIGPRSRVPEHGALRDRAWFNEFDGTSQTRPESYRERLERFSFSPDVSSAVDPADEASRGWYRAWKRSFDVVVAGAAMLVLWPLFLLVGLVVLLESRGPVFYRGEREGLGGRRFDCLKFRTMQVGAHGVQHLLKAQDRLDGPHFKLDQDPRVTRLGRLLRASNLDELPQLINVIRGEMSLVGPRPSPFRENQICVPWREGRLSVRPGVTGLWQLCRRDRSAGDFHQWIEYDLLYVQQASAALDVKILVATVLTLAGRVPVPADWLIRRPPVRLVDAAAVTSQPAHPFPRRGEAETGHEPERAMASHGSAVRHAPASSRSAYRGGAATRSAPLLTAQPGEARAELRARGHRTADAPGVTRA